MDNFVCREFCSPLLEDHHKSSTTHLAVIAHQDDAEIVGYSGIQASFQRTDSWFSSITLTNGSGASRGGRYQNASNDALSLIRQHEQEKAALLGEYAFCQQWLCSSQTLKDQRNLAVQQLTNELDQIRPSTIYTHNPFDKHGTHITVLTIVLDALKSVIQTNPSYQPKVYGVEVWGSLDWLPNQFRIELDCSPMPNLEQALIGLYDSQIDGNKGYDTAVLGRRQANATFSDSHTEDQARSVNLALDLSPITQGIISLNDLTDEILKTHFEESKLRIQSIVSSS
ncbi:PIG-L deacetylase family protein [Litoribrevibacter albus]|uniref:PIG-L family deacetylase n=1 Tax=Litoribrevibacter albus TaxID=1473156 RepID=A0AA37SAD8_9GAMM|nr:PIG-L family deacetylase [Litoribrevibacter albus]GLQ31599.1 hypothetical protein GCM10007876_20780 [Litoribrevibacter albus]